MKRRIETLKELNSTLKMMNQATASILKQNKDSMSNAEKITNMIKNLSEKKPGSDSKVKVKPMTTEKMMEEFLKLDSVQLEKKTKEFKELLEKK
jgi:hypothetical protein